MAWRTRHGIWYGLPGMAWYMVLPGGHGRVYGMAWRAYHGIWHIICSCLVGNGMVYGMACRAWHSISYGQARYGTVYGMARGHGMVWPGDVSHGIWYGLQGMAWHMVIAWRGIASYIVWPSGHGMVYDNAWRGMWKCLCEFHVLWHCLGLWSHSNVSWRSNSHIQDTFTSRWTVTCMFRPHVQLLFTLGRDSKVRDCEYIYISLFWDRTLDSHS